MLKYDLVLCRAGKLGGELVFFFSSRLPHETRNTGVDIWAGKWECVDTLRGRTRLAL